MDSAHHFHHPTPDISAVVGSIKAGSGIMNLPEPHSEELMMMLGLWLYLLTGISDELERGPAGASVERPVYFFFIRHCLDQKLTVPMNALSFYDSINTQLSRSFLCCANPVCEHNRLLKSSHIVFKKCSRCKGPSYCSRDCQKEHWPLHVKTCKKVETEVEEEAPQSA